MPPVDHDKNPWPGPRPYQVQDGPRFFGREREVREIIRRLLSEPLTIVSAESGAGKTSLLRAGVAYQLYQARRDRLAKAMPDGTSGQPPIYPVLLLADWGGGQSRSPDELLRDSLASAIAHLPDELATDREELARPLAGEGFFDQVGELCDRPGIGGLILVFDQFEEVLRGGVDYAQEAIDLIGDLYKYERRATLLISLRNEFHTDLRRLEALTGGLYNRTYFLGPMVLSDLRDAVLFAAEQAGVALSEGTRDQILETLALHTRLGRDWQGPRDKIWQERADLLTLQAVMRELYNRCRELQGEQIVIDQAAYETYLEGRHPEEVYGRALQRWIQDALVQGPGPDADAKRLEHLHAPLRELGPDELTRLVLRIAARMAPYLSSGGFKVAAGEQALMYNALREELANLTSSTAVIEARRWQLVPGSMPPRFDHAALQISEALSEGPDSASLSQTGRSTGWLPTKDENYRFDLEYRTSGAGRRTGWSPAETADHLASAFLETLHRLRQSNILKPVRTRTDMCWELVHDRLGEPFTAWAQDRVTTWDDTIAALTPVRGIDIKLRNQLQGVVVEGQVWQGDSVTPERGVELVDVTFRSCDLRGTIFRGCRFVGGAFEDCNMSGVFFRNCSFTPGKEGRPFRFTRCRAETMTVLGEGEAEGEEGSVLDSVRFESCRFEQVKFEGVHLRGITRFVRLEPQIPVWLFLSHFARLRGKPGVDFIRFDENCILEYCAWDRESKQLLDRVAARENATGEPQLYVRADEASTLESGSLRR